MRTVLISSELEGIVDKDNILGSSPGSNSDLIKVTCVDSNFSGGLSRVKKTRARTTIEISFLPEQMSQVADLLLKEEKKFRIGNDLSVVSNSENEISYSISYKKDMYIWKIIIDNPE